MEVLGRIGELDWNQHQQTGTTTGDNTDGRSLEARSELIRDQDQVRGDRSHLTPLLFLTFHGGRAILRPQARP